MQKGRKPDLTRLPAQLPDSVTLFLGREDYFPFRIDYLRSVPKASPKCLIRLEFFDLDFRPIDSGQFLFTPPGNFETIDRTDEFVRARRRAVTSPVLITLRCTDVILHAGENETFSSGPSKPEA